MTPDEYQQAAQRTLIPEPDHEISGHDMMMVWCATGLIGEAGETADYIKKVVFHQHPYNVNKLDNELGDVLWYVASLATLAGLDLAEIMERNIEKLQARYPNGYNAQDSRNRGGK